MVEKADKVKWSQAYNVMLVHMLTAMKNKGDWRGNNPKKLVWVECTKALAGSEKSGGITKQPDTIRGRWSKVPHLLSHTICYCTDDVMTPTYGQTFFFSFLVPLLPPPLLPIWTIAC